MKHKTSGEIVRISTIQLPAEVDGESTEEKKRNNLSYIRSMLITAGDRKSDLVLLGEYANLHHRASSDESTDYVAEDIPEATANTASEFARQYRMNVVVPLYGKYNGVISNYVVIIDRSGAIVDCYQKTHVTEQEQQLGMVPGNVIPVFKLDCCKIGCMTCMDIEYPEVAQILMLEGAQILIFPHVQASWGEVDWEIRYRARAIDTGLYVVSASYGFPAGRWSPGKIIGRSGIVGRDGLILADAGRSITVVTVDIDLSEKRLTEFHFSRKMDRTAAVIASRRPELYKTLIRK